MLDKTKKANREQFLSTREVAARLGVALSTVQAWVETGALPAWKTAGGHRRIPVSAVEALLSRQQSVLDKAPAAENFKVLVVEDDPLQRELYHHQFTTWKLPIHLLMAEDGFEGLLLIGRYAPDLIITDLAMPELDGFKMLQRLNALSTVHGVIIVVSALTTREIEAEGGLPGGIPVYPKPIPFNALRPLIEHLIQQAGT